MLFIFILSLKKMLFQILSYKIKTLKIISFKLNLFYKSTTTFYKDKISDIS